MSYVAAYRSCTVLLLPMLTIQCTMYALVECVQCMAGLTVYNN